jgi:hypothetical protein
MNLIHLSIHKYLYPEIEKEKKNYHVEIKTLKWKNLIKIKMREQEKLTNM